MKKKLKKIAIVIFILGLLLILYGIINYNKNENNKDYEINQETYLNLYNLYINFTEKNIINMSFDIINTSKNIINNQVIYLNFYQDNKLLYTYEYEIVELDSNNSIEIQTFIEFEFDNIEKYELVVNDIKKEIIPYYVNNN